MRDSLNRIVDALRESEPIAGSEVPPPPVDRQALRRSGWLKHLTALLEGATVIVRNVHVNASHVLVHCSDGWDRTAQLAAVAELCLDPYYRTLAGFQVLVEKDFVAFGHKFLDRSGLLSSDKFFHASQADNGGEGSSGASGNGGGGGGGDDDGGGPPSSAPSGAQAFFASVSKQLSGAIGSNGHLKETSPVFHQFLDCVYQLVGQHPTRFEFNELYLRTLLEHAYSGQFGTFLFNAERDRRTPPEFGPRGSQAPCERTVSVWDGLAAERERFRNPTYDRALDGRAGSPAAAAGADSAVLFPNPRDVKFWHELFRRGDEEMNGRPALPPTVEPPPPPPPAPSLLRAEQGGPIDPVVRHAVEGTEALEQGRPTEEGSFLTASIPYEPRPARAAANGAGSAPSPVDGGRTASGAASDGIGYRPFSSTSSAFSLKPSSAPAAAAAAAAAAASSSAPSSLAPVRSLLAPPPSSSSSHEALRSTTSPGSSSARSATSGSASSSSWGASWASLSTGAISALSGAAKEVGRAASTISAQAQAAAAARTGGGGLSPGNTSNGGGWRREDEMSSAMGSSSSTMAIPANPWASAATAAASDDDVGAPSSHWTSTSPPRAIPSPSARAAGRRPPADDEAGPIRPSLASFGASSVSQQWSFIEPPSTLLSTTTSARLGPDRLDGSAAASPLGGGPSWRGLEELSIDDVKAAHFPKREVRRANHTPAVVSDPRSAPPPGTLADAPLPSPPPPPPPPPKEAASFDPLGVGL